MTRRTDRQARRQASQVGRRARGGGDSGAPQAGAGPKVSLKPKFLSKAGAPSDLARKQKLYKCQKQPAEEQPAGTSRMRAQPAEWKFSVGPSKCRQVYSRSQENLPRSF